MRNDTKRRTLCVYWFIVHAVCAHTSLGTYGLTVVHYKEYKRHSVVNFKEYLITLKK